MNTSRQNEIETLIKSKEDEIFALKQENFQIALDENKQLEQEKYKGLNCAWCNRDLSDIDPKRFCVSPQDKNVICCDSICYHSYLGDTSKCTTDGNPPINPKRIGAPGPIGKDGQHEQYWVLCESERKAGFVRPVRRTYVHVGIDGHEIDPTNPAKSGLKGNGCGVATTMGLALCETYARDPGYYGSTFCVGCHKHFPVAEFKWNDGEVVGN